MAREMLHWDRPFHTVRAGTFATGDIAWFPEGGLNASYNCVDRWAFKNPDKVRLSYYSYIHCVDLSDYRRQSSTKLMNPVRVAKSAMASFFVKSAQSPMS